MKRAALVLVVVSALALPVAGCGGGSGNPTDAALSFVPKNAPVAVTIDTNPDGTQWKNVNALVAKFPFAGSIKTQLKQDITSSSGGKVSYDADVKPLLGNKLVAAYPSVPVNTDRFVLALKVNDEGKANKLLSEDPKAGQVGGVDVHRSTDGSSFSALDDGVLVLTRSRADLEAAIKRHGANAGMSESDLDRLSGGLSGDALVRIGANVQALTAGSPSSAPARKVKWVAALRNYGETFSAAPDGIQSNFRLTTDARTLSPSDLPLATGPQSPAVVRRAGEVGIGIRNAAQTIHFFESVGQVTSPKGYGRYLKQKRKANRKLGVNIDRAIVDQFTGDATLSVSLDGKVAFRSGLRDPKAFQATLAKIAPRLKKLNPKKPIGVSTPKNGKGFYAVAEANGNKLVFGVIGGNFVMSSNAARAAEIAGESPTKLAGTKGAGVLALDTRSVANAELRKRGQGAAALFTNSLGDLIGSVESETSGLTGSLKLNVK